MRRFKEAVSCSSIWNVANIAGANASGEMSLLLSQEFTSVTVLVILQFGKDNGRFLRIVCVLFYVAFYYYIVEISRSDSFVVFKLMPSLSEKGISVFVFRIPCSIL